MRCIPQMGDFFGRWCRLGAAWPRLSRPETASQLRICVSAHIELPFRLFAPVTPVIEACDVLDGKGLLPPVAVDRS